VEWPLYFSERGKTMKLLDLFSGSGGCSVGYARAGFVVTGVDNRPMPRYRGGTFVLADALEYLRDHGREYDVIHASPPCQRYIALTGCRPGNSMNHPDLIAPTRDALEKIGKPYVIENVMGSPLLRPIMLCGTMFGLALYRHRLFESSFSLAVPAHQKHSIPCSRAGHWTVGHIVSVCGNCAPIALARLATGIDWMTCSELAEAIPPAYTNFIGSQIMDILCHR
jgi:DNA (cytosine-5)-methyltransferase 1